MNKYYRLGDFEFDKDEDIDNKQFKIDIKETITRLDLSLYFKKFNN